MIPPLVLGIDLGGTQLRVALLDQHGTILRREARYTERAGGPEVIVEQINKLANAVIAGDKTRVVAVGVSAPGPLDSDQGRVIEIPTLPGWTNFPLRQVLSDEFKRPVVLENDGIAGAFGEWKFGEGRGVDNLVYVTVSTGIGGGIVADGNLLRGRRGMAGHLGHMMIDVDGPLCMCGGKGCFEVLASGSALNAAAIAGGYLDGKSVTEAARRGDARAIVILDNEADMLGYGFTSLLHLYSPQRLIVGGGVAAALDLMSVRIAAQVQHLAMRPFRSVEIVGAGLANNSSLVGAAMLALSPSDHK